MRIKHEATNRLRPKALAAQRPSSSSSYHCIPKSPANYNSLGQGFIHLHLESEVKEILDPEVLVNTSKVKLDHCKHLAQGWD